MRKELWAFDGNRIAVRFQYEWHDEAGRWWRSYGNEQWEFASDGLMARREASINDVAIAEADRRIYLRSARPSGGGFLAAAVVGGASLGVEHMFV